MRTTLVSRLMRWRLNLYGPYLGAGIRVERIAPDFLAIDVAMRLRPWTRNAVGTHFGGSLYSMIDPFYMLMLMRQLGPDYVVWDQAAQIDFLRPGRGTVRAAFRLDPAQLQQLREQAATGQAVRPVYEVEVRDEAGELVAHARKTLYVRLKPARRPPPAAEISAPDHAL